MEDAQRFVFEAVKMQMSQTKDGWALALRMHPDNLTMELMKIPVGQRLGVAIIPIDDDDGAFRHREQMSRIAKEEKEEAAHKRKYANMRAGLEKSPYLDMWAEELLVDEGVMDYIDRQCQADTWKERSEKIAEIVREVAEYAK